MNPIQNGLKKASILGFGIYWLMRALCAKIAEEVEERIDPWGSANTYLNAQLKRESLYNSTRFFHHLKALFNKCSRCSSSQRERIILCCFLDWCAIYVLHQDIFLLHYSRCRLLSPRYVYVSCFALRRLMIYCIFLIGKEEEYMRRLSCHQLADVNFMQDSGRP